MKFLKEISDFYRFFWGTSKEYKKIIFYAEHEIYYRNFEGILNELLGQEDRIVCYVTSDPNDPVLQKSEPRIKTFYLKKLLSVFMAFTDSKVFVMTMTDLNQLHIRRSINHVHYVYVFHSPVSTHMIYLFGAFDHYDSILCVGSHHKEEIRKHEALYAQPRKELIEAGYYPIERIYRQYQQYKKTKSSENEKTTILIAPSWGEKNILESCGEQLVQLLLEQGYDVTVRPHPETVKRMPKLIDALLAQHGDNPDFKLERTIVATDFRSKRDF